MLARSWPDDVYRAEIADLDVAQPSIFRAGMADAYLSRLRNEAPIHFCRNGRYGSYWSITRHADIQAIEEQPEIFSSNHSLGGIIIAGEPDSQAVFPMFIAMDPPRHGEQRRAIMPGFNAAQLKRFEYLIRSRAAEIIDGLPRGERFDWVEHVSIELTAMTLAMLLDYPQEHRRELIRWSNAMMAVPGGPFIDTIEQKVAILKECFEVFLDIRRQRRAAPPAPDLISMMAHDVAESQMSDQEYCGNVIMLITAGNDTTRNSITGSVVAFNQFPDQFARLKEDPSLVGGALPEIIRWQTPTAHMRRTAIEDVEFGGHLIRRGEKVVLWYLSANRDEAVFDRPFEFLIDRPNARRHLAFGHGIHRCIGAKLAELQIRILWEELIRRSTSIEVTGDPVRTYSTFIHGFDHLPVIIR